MRYKVWVHYYPETLLGEPFNVDERFKKSFPELFNINYTYEGIEDLPKENIWLLAEIERDKIVNVIETKPIEDFVATNEITKLINYNQKILSELKLNKVKTKYSKPDDLFISEMNWNLINSTLDLGKYPLLIGPKGCGKTSVAQALAKARGMKYYPINAGAIFKPKQTLVGQMQAKEGTTYLVHSEFLTHFTDDSDKGVVIFLDEISRIPQAAANYFMTILDRIQSYLYVEEEGRRITKGKNVVFVAAANFGYEYSDTRNLDGALIDRFIKFLIDYLPEKEEVELIKQRVPEASNGEVAKLVKFATMFRDNAEKLRISVSTRQLIDMSDYLPLGYDVNTIFNNIFINLFINGTMDERETVQKMMDSNS